VTALPCTLVGGWLGAGKTTLVNALLRQAPPRRLAVLVNDFGSAGIDASLVEGATGTVLELAGGCICCSYGADLLGTVQQVLQRQPRPDALLLETSGVADPAAVARSLRLLADVQLDGTVVVADAQRLDALRRDPYVGDTVRAQLAAADLLVLSKADLVEADALAGLRRTLPDVPVVDAEQGQLPIDVVLGLPAGRHPAPLAGAAGERFVSRSAGLPAPQDVDAIAQRLTQAGSGVLRAKGLLTGADGRRVLLQVVGRQAQLSPAPSTATGPDRLAVIGLLGLYDGAPWS
jgi:G3E family GTPase